MATCLLISSNLFGGNKKPIHLKAGTIEVHELNNSTSLQQVRQLQSNDGYVILQFSSVPTQDEKANIEASGIELLEYLPQNAFLSYLPVNVSGIASNFNIIGALPFSDSYKVNSELLNQIFPDHVMQGNNKVDVMVDRQLNVDGFEMQAVFTSLGATVEFADPMGESYIIRINKNKLNSLYAAPAVKYVDFAPPPPEKEDTRGRSLHRGNMLDSDHPLGRKYDGTGVSIAIADDGSIGPHIDIKGRVTQFINVDGGSHGDMTTGIAMGAGNLNPDYRGMATGAYLYYYDISGYPHVANAVSNLNTRGVVITSTSYSEGCNAGYTSTARTVDQQTRQNEDLLHVFSAGNSSSSTCGSDAYGAGTPWGTITGGRKQGKSSIATGNLDYLGNLTGSSSRGPAADGRIKPDICANGTNQMSTATGNNYQVGGGTSAAAPGIAGLSAQLYHGYRSINAGANPESGLIKAAMLNTARDIGNPGPDFFYGWGRVNAHRAMQLIEDNRYLRGTITQGVVNNHTVTLPANLDQLKLMVYWTDYEGSTVSSLALVNNLDIKVFTPNGDSLNPWILDHTPNSTNLSRNAVRGIDNRNNMEQVTVTGASSGTYTVRVTGATVPQGPQKYFLVWETLDDNITVTYPSGGESFEPGTQETIRWDAFGNTGSFALSYSIDSGATWTSIGTSSASNRYRNWTVPNNITGDAMIRVVRGSVTGVSANDFSIIPVPSGFSVQYVCPDSIKLKWNNLAGATEYEVSMLGAQYMDSVGRTSGLNFDLYNLNLADDNWVSVKALGNGIVGKRRDAIQMPKTPINCPIPYDIGVTQINSPSGSTIPSCSIDKLHIQVTINNDGDSVLSNVPIRAIAGNVTLHDTIFGNIPPRSFQFFTFRDSLQLSSGALTISVVTDLANDGNDINDSLAKTINVISSSVVTVPYLENFDNFSNCGTATNCGTTICNLSGGWTNMTNGSDDVHDMRVNNGSTASNNTGPSVDHTLGTVTGKYLYAESSGGCSGVESSLLSPCIDLNGTVHPELSFWYHMFGATMGVVRLDIMVDGNWVQNIMNPIFGDQGNTWQERTVSLAAYRGKKVTLRFRSTTGSSFTSDMAFDDIGITDISVGLDDQQISEFSLYPNPSDGIFTIELNEELKRTIQVFDLQGRVVHSFTSSNSKIQMNLNHLKTGLYYLDIEGIEKREKLILY